ncbi:MAG: integrase [Acidobacteria bacterium]|jgi:integrase/recombinase XerD|nr:MAG: integrase [Acidobacteriota bacterium]
MEKSIELWKKSLYKTKSQRTVLTYLQGLQAFKKLLGDDELLNVDPKVIYSYVDSSELSISSLLTHLSAIKHFYKFSFRRGWLSKEAYSEIEAIIEDIRGDLSRGKVLRKPRALTKEELASIFRLVRNTKYERIYNLFLYSGVRLSEYAGIRKDFFYKDRGIYWLRLSADITKGRKERIVPIIGPSKEETQAINERLGEWIERYEEYMRVNPGSLQVYTNRLSQKSGIDFSIHSFRHTYITNLVNAGFPAEVVKEFAGHANVKTTIDIYYRFSQERASKLVENFLR